MPLHVRKPFVLLAAIYHFYLDGRMCDCVRKLRIGLLSLTACPFFQADGRGRENCGRCGVELVTWAVTKLGICRDEDQAPLLSQTAAVVQTRGGIARDERIGKALVLSDRER